MAYLKGGSFVDGKLYVQDSIVVNRLEDNSGNPFPYYSFSTENANKNTIANRLVHFANENGGLDISNMLLEVKDGEVYLDFFTTQMGTEPTLNSNIYIKSDQIKLKDDTDWVF